MRRRELARAAVAASALARVGHLRRRACDARERTAFADFGRRDALRARAQRTSWSAPRARDVTRRRAHRSRPIESRRRQLLCVRARNVARLAVASAIDHCRHLAVWVRRATSARALGRLTQLRVTHVVAHSIIASRDGSPIERASERARSSRRCNCHAYDLRQREAPAERAGRCKARAQAQQLSFIWLSGVFERARAHKRVPRTLGRSSSARRFV